MTARRTNCAAMLMIATLLVRVSAADTTHWNVATPFPESSKPQTALAKATKKLSRSSNGELRVRLIGHYPDPGLSMLEILTKDDSVDAALVPYIELNDLTPDVGLYGQLFVFSGYSEVNEVRRLLDHVFLSHAQSDSYEVTGILGLGFVHLMSASRFASVADLSGQDILAPVNSTVYAGLLAAIDLNLQTQPADAPALLTLNSPSALILDRSIPRLEYIVWPPVQYAYLLLVAKRSRWEALPTTRRAEIEGMFVEQLSRLEQSAERTAERASRMLSKRGMRALSLSTDDIAALREAGTDHAISAELQSELRNALAETSR